MQKINHQQFQEDARQREQRLAQHEVAYRKRRKRLYALSACFGVVVLALATYGTFSYYTTPGPFDAFAKCLTEKGAQVYGADFCQYTKEQMGMFGKSASYLDYHEYSERDDIKITPTWVINGKLIPKVQSFEYLSQLTGCAIFPSQ